MIKVACEPAASVEELIEQHKRIASYHAMAIWRQKYRTGITYDDLQGAALVGLWDAAKRYDPARNAKFSTFCVLRVRGAIYDWIRTMSHGSRAIPRNNDSLDEVLHGPPGGRGRSKGGHETTLLSTLTADCDSESEMETDEFWERVTRGLSPTERTVLEMHYRYGETMKTIGVRLELTESRISQLLSYVQQFLYDKYRHDHRGDLTSLLFQELPGAIPCR